MKDSEKVDTGGQINVKNIIIHSLMFLSKWVVL
jgi:hypothetical protein